MTNLPPFCTDSDISERFGDPDEVECRRCGDMFALQLDICSQPMTECEECQEVIQNEEKSTNEKAYKAHG